MLYSDVERFQKSLEQQIPAQESKIKRIEAELSRKEFLEDKKQKHYERLLKSNEDLKQATSSFIAHLRSNYDNVIDNPNVKELVQNLSTIIKGFEFSAATTIEDVK